MRIKSKFTHHRQQKIRSFVFLCNKNVPSLIYVFLLQHFGKKCGSSFFLLLYHPN